MERFQDATHDDDTFIVEAFADANWAVLEDASGGHAHVPRAWLPEAAREGDVLIVRFGSAGHGGEVGGTADHVRWLSISVDAAATERRRTALHERHQRLPRAPSGDLDL